ncbi:hypothetical protein VNI00_013797 [Paramarasmius palmivorus]|uniref:Uncharacterized protein n=1 Tax=Paramarasmius palmivorus TaxID=297713 RepID=A0AAW0AYL8_9AGAR
MQTESTRIALQLNSLSWPQKQAVRGLVELLLHKGYTAPVAEVLRATTFMTDLADVAANEEDTEDDDENNESTEEETTEEESSDTGASDKENEEGWVDLEDESGRSDKREASEDESMDIGE